MFANGSALNLKDVYVNVRQLKKTINFYKFASKFDFLSYEV